MKYVLALDQGTTSSRAILFDKHGNMVESAQKEVRQSYPNPGWVEQDANEIWETQLGVANEVIKKAGISAGEVAAIGITNQRETSVVWDRKTGDPICPAIVWQCRRSAQICDKLKEVGLESNIKEKTGLVIDAYFSATKIKWILDNVPDARARAERGELCFGTIDTWLIWKMTAGAVHATDYSNASRTMLFNINDLCWDEEILKILDIPKDMLPRVVPSSGFIGETNANLFGVPVPIAGVAGDQQAALFGQACFNYGDVKNTYGTGAFLLMNTGEKPYCSSHGLITTIAWGLEGKVEYALEGSVFVAGAAIQWLRDELQIISSAAESETEASRVPDSLGCYVVPAFTGMGAPYWDAYARGTIVGLTRGTNKSHIIRATLEAIAFQVNDLLQVVQEDFGSKIGSLHVDGGASNNNLLMQMQADISNVSIALPACVETTALGSAYLAGLAVGYWKDKEDILANRAEGKTFEPFMSLQDREKKIAGWKAAVSSARGWAKEIK